MAGGLIGTAAAPRRGTDPDTGQVPFIETIASREAYRNPWMVLREDDIRRPDGSPGIYAVVDKPTYALVIPYDGTRLRLVEQLPNSWTSPSPLPFSSCHCFAPAI